MSPRSTLLAGVLLLLGGCAGDGTDQADFPRLTGDYLGQPLPGDHAEVFAPGIVDNGVPTRDIAFTPDGDEIYFCQEVGQYSWTAILVSRRTDGVWSAPEVAPFSGNPAWTDLEPAIAPDGQRFYFLSTRPVEPDGQPGQQDIWAMDRTDDGWSEPYNLGPPVNSPVAEFFPSPTRDGSLYFTRRPLGTPVHQIWRARPQGDGFAEPEMLPDEVNGGGNRFNALVAPDESWIIVPTFGMDDCLGGVDYYIGFHRSDDSWTGLVNMGPEVNDAAMQEWSPALSYDGRFLFVMSDRRSVEPSGPLTLAELMRAHREPGQGGVCLWWLSARVIDRLRAEQAADIGQGVGPQPAPDTGEAADPAPVGSAAQAAAETPVPVAAVLVPLARASRPLAELLAALPGNVPGDEAELFAPGLVCTGLHDRDVVFSAGGREIYFGLMSGALATVRVTRFTDDGWSAPELAGFATDRRFSTFEPTFSADGLEALFLTTMPLAGETAQPGWINQNLGRSRRAALDEPWGEVELVPGPVNTTSAEYFPSLTDDGVLYFTRQDENGSVAIWRAEPAGDTWAEPVKLPPTVNCAAQCYNATVARDESWLLYCVAGHADNIGPADYWLARRNPDGTWQAALNLGERVNAKDQRAGSITLTPDGRYLVFSARVANSERYFPEGRLTRAGLLAAHNGPENGALDVYWGKADFLAELQP